MIQCEYCDEEFPSEAQLDIHLTVNHREEASEDGWDYESEVSDGHLEEREIEKGEQFGYK